MRLQVFIENSMEKILQAWEDFARSVDFPQSDLDANDLRDYSEKVLRTVIANMRRPQTEDSQPATAPGGEPLQSSESAAQRHAISRLLAGYSIDQMVSEYRALRSCVLSLWLADETFAEKHRVQDMLRFNEAIEQVLVESIAAYGQAMESACETRLAVLGHDLRSPLAAILMAGGLIQRQAGLDEKGKALAAQVYSSARRANSMVNDLLDRARCNLGTGIPVQPENVDLNALCRSVVSEIRTGFPDAQIVLSESGQIMSQCDPARIAQVFANLVGNAIHHGNPALPIYVSLSQKPNGSQFRVQSYGEPIPPAAIPHLFKPQERFCGHTTNEIGPSGLGLGLFIVREIVARHGGKIDVESSAENGTIFLVFLPDQC